MSNNKCPRQINEAEDHRDAHSIQPFRVGMIQIEQFQKLGWNNCGVHGMIDVIGKEIVIMCRKYQFSVNIE